MERSLYILSDEQIAGGALRIRGRSRQWSEDLALFYMLFATAARPLEIARLEVRDYLDANGCVRSASRLRPEVAINGRERPMYFRSANLDEALGGYLAERADRKLCLSADGAYRGLHPTSRLFLSSGGQGFEITLFGEEGRKQYQCRGILEAYRKIFRYADFKEMTALRARHTVAAKLYARGADDAQVGLLLGIAEPSAVRAQFPRPSHTLEELVVNLI